MNSVKKVGKSGGFTIPAYLRRQLGIEGGEKMDISVEIDGSITLKRIQGTCILCGGYEDLKVLERKFICGNCINTIKEL